MKSRLAVLVLAGALWIPSLAFAAGGPLRTNDPSQDMWGTGSRIPISRALVNPLVKKAMSQFDAFGYIRVPTYDCSRTNGDTTIVFIAYQQPGVDLRQAMPLIVVFNLPNAWGPTVDIRGGILERGPDGTLHGASGASAHTVHVSGGGGLSTRATPIPVVNDPLDVLEWNSWVNCAIYFCEDCKEELIFTPVIVQVLCCLVSSGVCYKIFE